MNWGLRLLLSYVYLVRISDSAEQSNESILRVVPDMTECGGRQTHHVTARVQSGATIHARGEERTSNNPGNIWRRQIRRGAEYESVVSGTVGYRCLDCLAWMLSSRCE